MSTLTFLYKLTEDGRKQAFAATGNMPDAKQTASYDMTQATPEQRTALAAVTGAELKLDWINGHYNQPFPPAFEAEPTLPELIEALAQFTVAKRAHATEQIAETIAGKTKNVRSAIETRQSVLSSSALISQNDREKAADLIPDALAAYDAARSEHAVLAPAFAAEAAAQKARDEARRAEAEAKREARKAEFKIMKTTWIEQNGSEHLRRAYLAEGYDCQRLYVNERAAIEAPGFTLDISNNAVWNDRSCPSVKALDALDNARKLSIGNPVIVWLTNKPNASQDYYDDFQPCEAVVIRNYLDLYDLIQIV